MEKKYELFGKSDENGWYRIRALRDFGDVKKGDVGGFVGGEKNLSQDGDCWIYGDAAVFGNAMVSEHAKVLDNARVYEEAIITNYARVCGNAFVYGNTEVCNFACVCGNAIVMGNAKVFDNAKIYGSARVDNGGFVFNNAKIFGEAIVFGIVSEAAKVCGNAIVECNCTVSDNAVVCGCSRICSGATISGNAVVKDLKDYIVFKNWWSSGRSFTWTRSDNLWKVGCFHGTGEELIKKAYADNEEKGKQYENIVKYVENCVINQGNNIEVDQK